MRARVDRMMSKLRDIQQALQAHLLDPPNLSSANSTLDDLVLETTNVSRATRLHIYSNAYRARFVEALTADYGMLRRYIGDEEFEKLILAYIDAYPSRYFSLREVGARLEQFLQSSEIYCEHLDLIELVRFEWALCHAFDAADRPIFTSTDLAGIEPEQWPHLTVNISPTLVCIPLRINVPAIWKSLNADEAPPTAKESAEQMWLIWRRCLALLFRAALPQEMVALEAFRAGGSFADVCEQLAEYLPEETVPMCVVELLQQWLQDELIVA